MRTGKDSVRDIVAVSGNDGSRDILTADCLFDDVADLWVHSWVSICHVASVSAIHDEHESL